MDDDAVRFDPVVLSGNETLLLMAAREGMGLAFLPRVIVEDDLAAGALAHLLPTALTPSAPSTPSTPTAPLCPPSCGRFWIFWWRRGGEGRAPAGILAMPLIVHPDSELFP